MDHLEGFEIDFLGNSRGRDGIGQFQVHWKGYSDDDATWEPESKLHCASKIEEFQHFRLELVQKAQEER
jgi:hypothetical protein